MDTNAANSNTDSQVQPQQHMSDLRKKAEEIRKQRDMTSATAPRRPSTRPVLSNALAERLKQIHEKSDEMLMSVKQLESSRHEISSLKTQLESTEKANLVKQKALELQLRESEYEHQHVVAQLRTEIDQFKQQLEESRTKSQPSDLLLIDELKQRMASMEADMQRFSGSEAEREERLKAYEETIGDLQDQNQDLLNQARSSTLALEQERQIALEHQTELQNSRENLRQLENAQEDLTRAKQTVETELSETSQQVEEILEIYEVTQLENKSLKHTVEKLTEENGKLLERMDKVRNRMSIVHPQKQNQPQYISNDDQLLEFIETMASKCDAYRKEIDTLKQENQRLIDGRMSEGASGESDALRIENRNLKYDLKMITDSELILQAENNALVKELDRLSLEMADMNADHYLSSMTSESLQQQVSNLQERLQQEMQHQVESKPIGDEPSAVSSMRKDFREAFETLKSEFEETLQREVSNRKESEKMLQKLRHERNVELYSKSAQACQTLQSMTE